MSSSWWCSLFLFRLIWTFTSVLRLSLSSSQSMCSFLFLFCARTLSSSAFVTATREDCPWTRPDDTMVNIYSVESSSNRAIERVRGQWCPPPRGGGRCTQKSRFRRFPAVPRHHEILQYHYQNTTVPPNTYASVESSSNRAIRRVGGQW